jgi:uncharacterized integral membrane protein (TIGR00698 family)
MPITTRAGTILPGLLLCIAIAVAAEGLEAVEAWIFGRAWFEALVLAILIGMAIRTLVPPGRRYDQGIAFAAKPVLEVAVVLLGASISLATLAAAGPALIAGIAGVVIVAIVASYGLGRMLGLSHRLAVLVACGNSICGNSAIAATAPVIGADGNDVAASIAFTAALGIVVVLVLPLTVAVLGLTPSQYGIFAGLTVYAVPQVLAATAPVSALSLQVGTLVKLVRVLMLGPVIMVLALVSGGGAQGQGRIRLGRLVPWFILGFLALTGLNSLGLVPQAAGQAAMRTATILTIVAMAALGLGCDIRTLVASGGRVTATAVLSLCILAAASLLLIRFLAAS